MKLEIPFDEEGIFLERKTRFTGIVSVGKREHRHTSTTQAVFHCCHLEKGSF